LGLAAVRCRRLRAGDGRIVRSAVPVEREKTDLAVVSYFNPSDVVGGAERVAWAEAELLSRKQSVVFLSASLPVGEAPFRQVRVGGWARSLYQPKGKGRNPVKLVVFHLLSLFNPFVFFESLAVFRRIRPAVVHTHNLNALSPSIWLAARLSGARVLHTHHGLWLNCERATMTDDNGRPCNQSQPACLICMALRPAKKVQMKLVSEEIFPSNWLRGRLGRSGTLAAGFSTSTFTEGECDLELQSPATVVFVGELSPPKVGALLAGFEIAAASGEPPMQLVIAGAGPLAASIRAVAESNPRVSYLGLIDSDTRDLLLQRTAVLLIPSTCPEASSLVYFEALAAGLPVIASAIGALTEHERYGNVVLVPPGDAEALADALVGVLTDQAGLARLRRAALRHRDVASPERFASTMESVISAVRERDGPAGRS
jgi:glycosyltransferase involved in cell wall biosynthesis